MEFASEVNSNALSHLNRFQDFTVNGNPTTDFDPMDMDMFDQSMQYQPNFQFDSSSGPFFQQYLQQNVDPRSMNLAADGSSNHVTKNGLITPPSAKDDESQVDGASEVTHIGGEGWSRKQEGQAHPKVKEESRKSRQSSNGSATSTKSRVSRKASTSTRKARKGYKATTKEEENDPEGEEKRQKFLERNRVAASKCRDKKKIWTEDQEGKLRNMQASNKILRSQFVELQREIVMLKEAALPHFDCNPAIRQYLVGSVHGQSSNTEFGTNPPGSTHDSPSASGVGEMDSNGFLDPSLQQQAAATHGQLTFGRPSSAADGSTPSIQSNDDSSSRHISRQPQDQASPIFSMTPQEPTEMSDNDVRALLQANLK